MRVVIEINKRDFEGIIKEKYSNNIEIEVVRGKHTAIGDLINRINCDPKTIGLTDIKIPKKLENVWIDLDPYGYTAQTYPVLEITPSKDNI